MYAISDLEVNNIPAERTASLRTLLSEDVDESECILWEDELEEENSNHSAKKPPITHEIDAWGYSTDPEYYINFPKTPPEVLPIAFGPNGEKFVLVGYPDKEYPKILNWQNVPPTEGEALEAAGRLLFVYEGYPIEGYERQREEKNAKGLCGRVPQGINYNKYGIGSKLVRGMGWSDGEGLGTENNKGRVHPVEAIDHPKRNGKHAGLGWSLSSKPLPYLVKNNDAEYGVFRTFIRSGGDATRKAEERWALAAKQGVMPAFDRQVDFLYPTDAWYRLMDYPAFEWDRSHIEAISAYMTAKSSSFRSFDDDLPKELPETRAEKEDRYQQYFAAQNVAKLQKRMLNLGIHVANPLSDARRADARKKTMGPSWSQAADSAKKARKLADDAHLEAIQAEGLEGEYREQALSAIMNKAEEAERKAREAEDLAKKLKDKYDLIKAAKEGPKRTG